MSPSVDIREIKEIRTGQKSRDFDRYVEDSAARPDQAHCFVILYGTEFRLKALSLAGNRADKSTGRNMCKTSVSNETILELQYTHIHACVPLSVPQQPQMRRWSCG